MKKLLILLLAVLTVASIVTAAAFTVSAAEYGKLSEADLSIVLKGKTQLTVSAYSTDHFSGNIGNLFDGNFGTAGTGGGSKWEGNLNNETATVYFELESAAAVKYFVLYTGNDSGSYARNPSAVRFYGSETKDGEYTLISDIASAGMGRKHATPYGWEIDEPVAYQYYKMEFDGKTDKTSAETEAATKDGYFQLNELRLFSDSSNGVEVPVKDTDPDSLTYGRYKIPATLGLNGDKGGHGFLDGYFTVNDSSWRPQKLLNTNDFATAMDGTSFYLDGKEVRINYSYLGYTHSGFGNNAYFFGIVGAEMTKGKETTFTVLIGDGFYYEVTFTPNHTCLGVTDSMTVYLEDGKTLYSTVTFENAPALSIGDEVRMQIHDEHSDHTAVVTAIDGNTVSFKVENFTTTHSICEFYLDDGVKFSCPIDSKGQSMDAFIQLRPNESDVFGTFDSRVIIEGYEDILLDYSNARLDITFTYGDGQSKTFTHTETTVYKSLIAGGETLTASEGFCYFGVAITDIPNDTYDVTVKLTMTKNGEDTVKTYETSGIHNPYADFEDQKASAEKISLGYDSIEKFSNLNNAYGPCFTGSTDVATLLYEQNGTVVLEINGEYYRITENEFDDANNGYYGRYGASIEGAQFLYGATYKITLYAFNANYEMVYYSDERTCVSTLNSSNAVENRTPLTTTLPNEGLTQIAIDKITSVTVTGCGQNTNEGVTNLFDGNINTKHCGTVNSDYDQNKNKFVVDFTVDGGATLAYYTFTTGNDNGSNIADNRNPNAWTLYGKVDGEWVALSEIQPDSDSCTGLELKKKTTYAYEITNSQACTEYRIEFTRTGTLFEMSEITLYTK